MGILQDISFLPSWVIIQILTKKFKSFEIYLNNFTHRYYCILFWFLKANKMFQFAYIEYADRHTFWDGYAGKVFLLSR